MHSIGVCSKSFTETDYKMASVLITQQYCYVINIVIVMSTLFSDIHRRMEAWGTDGKMNPFKDIYDLVFQMTVRIASCEELATDPIAVQKVTDLYWMLEKSITPVGLLLPWFPGRAQKLGKQATKGLYDLLLHYVNIRRKAEVRNSDAIDVLIADGEDDHGIVEVCASPASCKSRAQFSHPSSHYHLYSLVSSILA
jgi:hypothetical protein